MFKKLTDSGREDLSAETINEQLRQLGMRMEREFSRIDREIVLVTELVHSINTDLGLLVDNKTRNLSARVTKLEE